MQLLLTTVVTICRETTRTLDTVNLSKHLAMKTQVKNFTGLESNTLVWSYHVTYTFQSDSTLYSYLNVKKLFVLLETGAISEV